MNILILGKGWLGSLLQEHLLNSNHKVSVTTTDGREGIQFILGESRLDLSLFDYIICTVCRQKEGASTDQRLLKQLELNPKLRSSRFIFLSTIGVYGENKGMTSEEDNIVPTKRAQQSYATEKVIQEQFSSYTILRLGGLIGPKRDASNFFKNKKSLVNSKAPVNLIHSDDILSSISLILEHDSRNEVYNLVSNDHRSKEDFYLPLMDNQSIAVDGLGEDSKVVSSSKFTKDYGLKFCSNLISKYYLS